MRPPYIFAVVNRVYFLVLAFSSFGSFHKYHYNFFTRGQDNFFAWGMKQCHIRNVIFKFEAFCEGIILAILGQLS